MSDDLRRLLRVLEDDYPNQPLVARAADLREINRVRAELGLPAVDARLKEVGAADAPAGRASAAKPARDHSAAREIYRAYLDRTAEMDAHRAYATRVERATRGNGMTPVKPLATMGTGGGPLLCDHCGEPIILEGGAFHKVNADVAWARNPRDGWASFISGGMVVHVQSNGTLRVYHGYPGRGGADCCNVAARRDNEARDEFQSRMDPAVPGLLRAFFEDESPDRTRQEHFALISKVVDTLYSYDPGIGVNRPDAQK